MERTTYGELSRFVLTRGLVLCILLLAGTMAVLLWARGAEGMTALRLYDCADVFRFSALVAFACALFGSLLTEDMLRYYGE